MPDASRSGPAAAWSTPKANRRRFFVLLDGETLRKLTEVQDEAIERLPKAPKLTPMQTNDAEDEISDWLEARDIDGAWELAPTLVAAGVDADWLDSTLAMLGSKIKGNPDLHVVKEYDRTSPDIPAYPGELNQVWTI